MADRQEDRQIQGKTGGGDKQTDGVRNSQRKRHKEREKNKNFGRYTDNEREEERLGYRERGERERESCKCVLKD